MSVNWTDKDLGVVSAFGVAKEHGWTGTEEEWEALQAAAPQAGSDAEAYGAGTRSGTAVGSTDPAYQNNAKYYKEQAAGSALSAAASAADALQHTQGVIEVWLDNHVDPETGYVLDRTLTQSNAATPADITGDLKSALPSIAHEFYTIIPNSTDYDTLLTPGTYLVASAGNAQTMTHCPTSWAHKMYVVTTTNTNRLYQILIANDDKCSFYMRYYQNSWNAWNQIAKTSDIPTAAVTANTADITKIKGALPALSIETGLWTNIASNTDYNNLTTPGTYICVSFSAAITMTHCPTQQAHKLLVMLTTGNNKIYQIIFANDTEVSIYKRLSLDGTTWSAWEKEVNEKGQHYRVLVIGDSYSAQGRWTSALSDLIKIDSLVNLGVVAASLRDKYTNRTTYPYTSRPVKTDNTGNHNCFMCQIEKLKRLMEGTDLDEGEEQIYTTESDYPNVIIIEGGQNDNPDSDSVEETYSAQFMKEVSNVYVADNSQSTPTLGSAFIKLPSEECNRTCFAGAYRSLVEELQTLFPKAQIFATSRSILGYWNEERFPEVTKIRLQQELACNMVGINFINWQSGVQINLMNNYPKGSGTENDPYCIAEVAGSLSTHDTYDLLHPFTLGAKKYAKVVANAITQQFLDMESM